MASLLFGCQQPEIFDNTAIANDADKSVLATKQKANPFTVENMKRAIINITRKTALKSGRTACFECIPSTTHNYVRFAPENIDQLIILHNYGYDLYDVPLDQEVTTQGEYYQDPSLPADANNFV